MRPYSPWSSVQEKINGRIAPMHRWLAVVVGIGLSLVSLTQRPAVAAAEEWGPVQQGLKVRLTIPKLRYVLGRPIKYWVDVKNESDAPKTLNPYTGLTDPLEITDAAGNHIPYRGPPYEAFYDMGPGPPIKPGETRTLTDGRDLSKDYALARPGHYTVQFRGALVGPSPVPPSNRVDMEVVEEPLTPSR